MGFGAGSERGQVVAALQQRDDAAFGVAVGNQHDFFGQPLVVFFHQIQMAERIVAVGVETGGQQNKLRLETRPPPPASGRAGRRGTHCCRHPLSAEY